MMDQLQENKRSKAIADSEIIHGQKPPPPPGAKHRVEIFSQPPSQRKHKGA